MLDIRTILLAKIKPSSTNNDNEFFSNNCANNYITIGNYDAMMIYNSKQYIDVLENNDTNRNNGTIFKLEEMYEEKVKITQKYININSSIERNFYHPIHITTSLYNSGDIEKFWNSSSICIAITILYSDNSNMDLKALNEKIVQNKDDTVTHRIYRSLNMAEVVIVWKSDTLRPILDSISNFNYISNHIYTHTICGVNYTNIKGDIETTGVDNIPLLKISGIINKHTYASKCFDLIRTSLNKENSDYKYLSFGNNDFNLIFYDVSTISIIKLLKKLITHAETTLAFASIKTRVNLDYKDSPITNQVVSSDPNIISENVPSCFSDDQVIVVANSEIKESDISNDDWANEQMTILENSKLITSIRNSMIELAQDQKQTWLYPFIEVLNMLSDMYNNLALSNIRYFVTDSLLAFHKELDYIINSYSDNAFESIIETNLNSINDYISSINTLIRQLVRVDGYMSQEPGFSPLIYNMITADILEYYNAYIYKLITFLSEYTDKEFENAPQKYSMLLCPSLKRRIIINSVFILDHTNKTPVFPPYQTYLVEIPYKQQYELNTTLCTVTHEIMHFCGETLRCRKERFYAILSFIAEAIIEEFSLLCESNATTEYLFDYLKTVIKYDEHGIYLNNLKNHLPRVIEDLYNNKSLKENLLIIYSKASPYVNMSEKIYLINNASVQTRFIYNNINLMLSLFKECYADLISILVVNINVQEYFDQIYKEILSIPDMGINNGKVSFFVQRVSLIFATLYFHNRNKEIDDFFSKNICDQTANTHLGDLAMEINRWTNLLLDLLDVDEMPEKDYSIYFSLRSLLNVYDYLDKCCKEFESLSGIDESLKDIRETYHLEQHKIFTDEFYKKINDNRKRIDEMLETLM